MKDILQKRITIEDIRMLKIDNWLEPAPYLPYVPEMLFVSSGSCFAFSSKL